MTTSRRYQRGDIVLVPFPFTDLSGGKPRPALVMSDDAYNRASRDLILMQITGNVQGPARVGDHRINEWGQAGLLAPSVARAKLVTLESTTVRRQLGQMPARDMAAIEANLRVVLRLP